MKAQVNPKSTSNQSSKPCTVLQYPSRKKMLSGHRQSQTYCRWHTYGVATISRLLKIIGFFCRISSLLQGSFAKETYHFREPTNRSHPIRLVAAHAWHYSLSYMVYCQRCTRGEYSGYMHYTLLHDMMFSHISYVVTVMPAVRILTQ